MLAISGIPDHRTTKQDTNIWRKFLASRRGYIFLARVLHRIIRMFRSRGSKSKRAYFSVWNKALMQLFSSERK